MEGRSLHQDELRAFLEWALANGWPKNTEPSSHPGLSGFYETTLTMDPWSYFDVWTGATTDVGMQIVRKDDQAVWACTYRGGLLFPRHLDDTSVDGNPVFSFLVEALSSGPDKHDEAQVPIRGPARYTSTGATWTYTFRSRGDLASFQAIEGILEGPLLVYERHFIGGAVGDGALHGRTFDLEVDKP